MSLYSKGTLPRIWRTTCYRFRSKQETRKARTTPVLFWFTKEAVKSFSTQFIKMIKITSVLLVFCSSFSSGHFPNCNCNFFLASMIQLGARPGYGFPYLILLLPIHKNIFQCSSVCLLFFHIKFFKFQIKEKSIIKQLKDHIQKKGATPLGNRNLKIPKFQNLY